MINEALKGGAYYTGLSDNEPDLGKIVEVLPWGRSIENEFMGGKREDVLKEREREKQARRDRRKTLSHQLTNLNLF